MERTATAPDVEVENAQGRSRALARVTPAERGNEAAAGKVEL